MIVFHHKAGDPFSEEVAQSLKELVVAHKLLEGSGQAPAIEEDHTLVQGEAAIRAYLHELSLELTHIREIQSDACYLDPETGEMC
ncbi:MAG: hypothetical protein D6730_09020 [Bacteroidetes bacterium]|nr:MAG: hypothetical protein D6730_09020 [Bacteroidota bacterium]